MTEVFTHPFQTSGLGVGPFKFIGIQENLYYPCKELDGRINTSVSPMPGGCCAYCGNSIRYECIIRDSNGKTFTVGTDCVRKTESGKMVSEVARAKADLMKQKKAAKKAAEREARLSAEREKNNGLTDYELRIAEDKKRMEEINAARLIEGQKYAIYADQLEDGKGGFCDSIAAGLREGTVPSGRGFFIMIDILAKKAGRANSHAYKTKYNEVAEYFGQKVS